MNGLYTYREVWTSTTRKQKFVRGRLIQCNPFLVWEKRIIKEERVRQ